MSQYVYSDVASEGHRCYIKYDITQTSTSWSITYAVGIEATKNAINYKPDGLINWDWESDLIEYRTDGTTWEKKLKSSTMTCGYGNKKRLLGEYTRSTTKGHSSKRFSVNWGSAPFMALPEAKLELSISPKPSYTVKYNANGGLNTPASATKWYNETLKITSTIPTRTGYAFKGWATSATGAVKYSSGASYTSNSAVTLYAVWEKNSTSPTISSLSAYRSSLYLSIYLPDDEGTVPTVKFAWTKATATGGTPVNPTSITVGIKKTSEIEYTEHALSASQITNNSVSVNLPELPVSTDYAYDVKVSIITDGFPTVTRYTYITEPYFVIDINQNGTAIGFGQSVKDDDNGIFSNMPIYIKNQEVIPYEKGTITAGSVTWKYRKYSDGSLEMWGSATTTLAIATASGSIYTTASEYDIAMPAFVSTIDFASGELSGGGWVDITGFNVPPKMRLYAPTSYSSASRILRYYISGTWK